MRAAIHKDNNLAVVERLLSSLVQRVRNALEMWSLVCLGPLVPDRKAFLDERCEVLRAHLLVIREWLQENGGSREALEAVASLLAAVAQFHQAFRQLADYPDLALADIKIATDAIADAYQTIQGSAAALGDAGGFEVSALSDANLDREAYFRQLLDHLFETFRAAREAALPAAVNGVPGKS